MIAWGRSRATSTHGIIWGDAGQNKQNRATDSNKIEVIVLDDQKSRELRKIRTTGQAVYLYDCTILKIYIKCGHGEMRNKWLRNRKNDITQGWRVLQSLILPSKGNEKKKLLQHVVFIVGRSSRCERRRTGLNFVEWTRRDAVLVV